VDAVSIPVIAAGGLFDGRGLAAALAMGCEGVWMGTRFIASTEAHAGQPYKDAIVGMTESDTVISRGFTGKTLRAIRNRTTDEWATKEAMPFAMQIMHSAQNNLLGPIAGIVEDVNPETQCLAAGQGGGAITEILPCAAIIRRTLAEADTTLARLARLSG